MQLPTIMIVILSLVVLFVPFLYFYKSSKISTWIIILGYLLCAAPMLYVYIDDVIKDYKDANIGLGLGIFSTWFLTICMYILMLILFILRKWKRNK